jgi:parallel beta-helix repeat protein
MKNSTFGVSNYLHSKFIKMNISKSAFGLLTLISFLFIACSEKEEVAPRIDSTIYNQLQAKLMDAKPGDVIEIPAGTYYFDRPLSLEGISGVTLRGAGKLNTVLSFLGQKVGAEGIRIIADSVVLSDLTVQDTKGDAIKIQDATSVTLRNIRTTWSGGPKETNGGYGIYPVACKNVLIEGCEASYASDAGIYVGQSSEVIVRNCHAHGNVAGIEIENCQHSQVYGNLAEGNTGGILVFDLPELPAGNGFDCRVFQNMIRNNNLANFAPPGNIVGIVPAGTGIILLAAKSVAIYDNQILGHKTIGTAIASYGITQKKFRDPNYNPYTYNISIRNNTFKRAKSLPDWRSDFGKMAIMLFWGKPQDILYDGILNPEWSGKNPMFLCIEQNQSDLRFANIDAGNDFNKVVTDMSSYVCKK